MIHIYISKLQFRFLFWNNWVSEKRSSQFLGQIKFSFFLFFSKKNEKDQCTQLDRAGACPFMCLVGTHSNPSWRTSLQLFILQSVWQWVLFNFDGTKKKKKSETALKSRIFKYTSLQTAPCLSVINDQPMNNFSLMFYCYCYYYFSL